MCLHLRRDEMGTSLQLACLLSLSAGWFRLLGVFQTRCDSVRLCERHVVKDSFLNVFVGCGGHHYLTRPDECSIISGDSSNATPAFCATESLERRDAILLLSPW